jgi:ribonuclease Z
MAHAGKMINGHFSTRYKSIEPFLEEARAVFSNSEAAVDGSTYIINHKPH